MKKTLCLVLACILTLGCMAFGSAMADKIEPNCVKELTDVENIDLYMLAKFDPETAFDADGKITVLLQDEELYAAKDIEAVKVGDTVVMYGEEHVIRKIEAGDEGTINFYVEGDEGIWEFFHYDDDTMYTSDCDFPSRADVGTFTFPMAEQVKLTVWYLTEDGEASADLKTEIVPAADVQAYLLARSDYDQEDFLNCMGNHVHVRVEKGLVTEISISWGSDD